MKFRSGWHIVLLMLISFSCKKQETNKQIIVLGHAGTTLSAERAVFPPNSEESITYALDILGADGVEVDIQLTKDSNLVMFHDDFLDETTDLEGCIAQYNLDEILNAKYKSFNKILTLEHGLKLVMERRKQVMLDVKHYDFCNEKFLDYSKFDRALNRVLKDFSVEERKRITINSRQIPLLDSISDTVLTKSFETVDIPKGIVNVVNGHVDLLAIKLSVLSHQQVKKMQKQAVTYCIFGVKTKKEIKEAIEYKADLIISDNIAQTKKILN